MDFFDESINELKAVNSSIAVIWQGSEYASGRLLRLLYNIFKKNSSIFLWVLNFICIRWSLDKQTVVKHYFLASDMIRPVTDMLWEISFLSLERQSSKKHYERPKQSSLGVFIKRFSENILQIPRRKTMLKCDFNKVAFQLYWNHTLAWVLFCKFPAYFQITFI